MGHIFPLSLTLLECLLYLHSFSVEFGCLGEITMLPLSLRNGHSLPAAVLIPDESLHAVLVLQLTTHSQTHSVAAHSTSTHNYPVSRSLLFLLFQTQSSSSSPLPRSLDSMLYACQQMPEISGRESIASDSQIPWRKV